MRILGYLLVVLFVTTSAFGQQINPVPDYIFRYQMSVGRNAPTDTAAYLSVGPRYGANKGLMPPMVVDTNAVTGVKRNGLLIFSVQLNNFAYWDSTTSRFRKITAEAVVDSVVFSTRAWRKKGDDSLGAVISQRTDTALLSTRAYRQKGVDSLVTLISTLGGGTVLSVSAGTGMNFTTITTSGSVSADTNVLATRANRDKLKDSLQANIAGKVNISDTATMLAAYLRKADTTSMLSPYLRKVDTTAMLTPYVRIAGFGLTKGTQALSVDSALIATRARVQKGIDSVASLVTTTDSLLFSTRAWRQKGVDSVAALANTKATATGTTNYLSKFTGTSSLGNSIVYATTSEVGISTPSPTESLDVNGRVRVRTIDSTATGMNMLYADATGVIKKAAVPAGGSGTVTSVSAGTGMSFTTITSTGSVSADTVALSTRAWRQKGIDSLAASEVSIADTATMLSPYNRGSGTLNFVPKYLETGRRLGNSQIFDNGTSVGIGTTTPSEKLDVSGFVRSTSGIKITDGTIDFRLSWASANRAFIGNLTSHPLSFFTNNAERVRIFNNGNIGVNTFTDDGTTFNIAGTLRSTQGANFATSSGSVGIGFESPTSLLHIRGNTSVAATIHNTDFGSNSTPAEARLLFRGGSAVARSEIASQDRSQNAGGGWLYFRTGSSTDVLTDRMVITNAGNVGIGTTSPSYTLDVTGTLRSTQSANFATTSGVLAVGTTATSGYKFQTVISDANKYNPNSVLSNSANVQIMNSSTTDSTGSNLVFQATGSGAASGMSSISGIVQGDGKGLLTFGTRNVSNASVTIERMRIDADGRVGIGTTSPSSLLHVSSDASNIRKSNAAGTAYTEHTNDGLIATGTSLTLFAPTSQSLILSSGNGEAARFNANKRLLVNTTTDAGYLVNVNGTGRFADSVAIGNRLRVSSIDSSASPINMLWADNSGVIRKAAVPSGGGGTVTSVSAGTGMSFTTITTTGSVAVDTLSIATRARLYKTIDSMKSAGYTNLYNSNGTLTGNRVISKNGSNLTLSGDVGEFRVENAAGTSRVAVTNDGIVATGTSLTLFAPSAQPLILSSGNGEAGRFSADKEFIIGTTSDAGDYKLQVNGNGYVSGRMNIASVDSFSTAQNMLFVDNDGRIKKAAVPAGGGGGVTSVATGFGIDGGTITSTGTLTADTVEMATRARLYKTIDSMKVAGYSNVYNTDGTLFANRQMNLNGNDFTFFNTTGDVIRKGSTNNLYIAWTINGFKSNERGMDISIDTAYDFSVKTGGTESMRITGDREMILGFGADQGTYKLQVSGATLSSDGFRTTAPSGGTAATWKLGTAATVSPTSPNRTIEVEIDGTTYYIHAKTTNN